MLSNRDSPNLVLLNMMAVAACLLCAYCMTCIPQGTESVHTCCWSTNNSAGNKDNSTPQLQLLEAGAVLTSQ